MKHIELISMKIISSVGAARSMYVEAIHFASKGEFAKANDYIKKAMKCFSRVSSLMRNCFRRRLPA